MVQEKNIPTQLCEWDSIRSKAREVLKHLGHDIPLVRREKDDTEITNIKEESYVDINSK